MQVHRLSPKTKVIKNMECLETEKVCSNCNKKCKECELDDCKNMLKILEEDMNSKEKLRIKLIKAQLPEQCRNCSFLEIEINGRQEKVKCFYNMKGCILK